MRIAVIGDLQLSPEEHDQLTQYIHQVNQQGPDLAVFMGDMGYHGRTGSLEGMQVARQVLSQLACPFIPLMGNHDVEYLPGEQPERTPEQWYAQVFGCGQNRFAAVEKNVLLLGVSVERQPTDQLLTRHGLYVSDEQFRWVESQLQLHSDKPTILFTHAPMAGSGIRNCPPTHSAATDAYLDHSYAPERWKSLARQYPQIRAWCSAHFHMGHHYPTALTWAENVLHISCGVMTSAARDRSRQTRILDITDEGRLEISTLDHLAGSILPPEVSMSLSGERVAPQGVHVHSRQNVAIGADRALQVFSLPEKHRFFITTDQGKLWEYDRELGEILGALRKKALVLSMAYDQGRFFWQENSGEVYSVSSVDRARFDLLDGLAPQNIQKEASMPDDLLKQASFEQVEFPEGWHILLDSGK